HLHPLGHLQAGELTRKQRLDDQLFHALRRQPEILERVRNRRRRRQTLRRRLHRRAHFWLSASGKSTSTNLMAAGPMVTTQIAGKMQNTSGKTIFTPVLAAASSARCRRLVRSVSEWTRSERATLVPNLSVWISIAASDERSSTPVRSARLRSASPRPLPARSSRLISRSSPDSSGCANV